MVTMRNPSFSIRAITLPTFLLTTPSGFTIASVR